MVGALATIGPVVALLAAVACAVALLVVRYPFLTLMLIAVYTPFEEFLLKWLPPRLASPAHYIPEAMIMFILACLLGRNLLRGVWRRTPIDLPCLAFLLVTAASAVKNTVPSVVWLLGIREFGRYILLYYALVNCNPDRDTIRRYVRVLVAVAVIETFIGLVQAIIGTPAFTFLAPRDILIGGKVVRQGITQALGGHVRVFGTTFRYNALGFFITIFTLVTFGVFQTQKQHKIKTAVQYGALWLLFGVVLVLTVSRTSWLGLYVGIITILAIRRRLSAVLLIIVPVLITIVLASIVEIRDIRYAMEVEPSPVRRYVATFTSAYHRVLREHGRLFSILEIGPTVLRKEPLLGFGPGTIGSLVTGGGTHAVGFLPQYSREEDLGIDNPSVQFLHDTGWIAILAQIGLVGLTVLWWIFLRLARAAWRCYRRVDDTFGRGLALGLLGCLAAVVVGNFFIFLLALRSVSLYIWLFGALTTSYCGHTLRASRAKSTREVVQATMAKSEICQ
jgi:ABC-type multidrug transport system fused ATPase/permease subunit